MSEINICNVNVGLELAPYNNLKSKLVQKHAFSSFNTTCKPITCLSVYSVWSSYSHYLVSDLAGVSQRRWAGGWGYRSLNFLPASAGLGLSHARAEIDLPVGRVVHSWRRHGGVQCGKAAQGRAMRLECGKHGGVIVAVDFASFGAPRGICGAFEVDSSCHASTAANIIAEQCLGRSSCEIQADPQAFTVGPGMPSSWCDMLNQPGSSARLWAQVQCSALPILDVHVEVPLASTAQVVLPVRSVIGMDSGRDEVVVTDSISGTVLFPVDADGPVHSPDVVDVLPMTAVAGMDHAKRKIVTISIGSGVYDLSMSSIQL